MLLFTAQMTSQSEGVTKKENPKPHERESAQQLASQVVLFRRGLRKEPPAISHQEELGPVVQRCGAPPELLAIVLRDPR